MFRTNGPRRKAAAISDALALGTTATAYAKSGSAGAVGVDESFVADATANVEQYFANKIAYGHLATLGVHSAIGRSVRKNDLTEVSGTGHEAALKLIRKDNGLNAGWVQAFEWDHHARVDAVLRLLSGQEPAESRMPITLYDKGHNMPESGPFVSEVDFRRGFLKAWGMQ